MAESIDTSDFTPQREWTPKGERPKVSQKEIDAFWEEEQIPENEKEMLDLLYDRIPAISDRQKKLQAQVKKMQADGQIIDFDGEVF